MVSATTQPSAPFRTTAPRAPLSRRPRLRSARPPSPPIAPFRAFTRNADTRFCESDCRPTTSATASKRTDTPTSFRFPLDPTAPRYAATSNSPSLSLPFLGATTFPSRRRITSATSRDSPFDIAPTALQVRRQTYDIESHRPVRTPLAGDASTRSSLCGDDWRAIALDCTGRMAPSEGSPLPAPAAAERRGRRFPSSAELSAHPLFRRRFFVRRAG